MNKMIKIIFTYILLIFFAYSTYSQEIELAIQKGHSTGIYQIAFSNNDELLASSGSNNQVIIWDIRTGKKLLDFVIETEKINYFKFDELNNYLCISTENGLLYYDIINNTFNNSVSPKIIEQKSTDFSYIIKSSIFKIYKKNSKNKIKRQYTRSSNYTDNSFTDVAM